MAAYRVDLRSGTDAQLRRGGGEAARVFHEQVQDPVVDGVDIREGSVGRGSADDSVERLA